MTAAFGSCKECAPELCLVSEIPSFTSLPDCSFPPPPPTACPRVPLLPDFFIPDYNLPELNVCEMLEKMWESQKKLLQCLFPCASFPVWDPCIDTCLTLSQKIECCMQQWNKLLEYQDEEVEDQCDSYCSYPDTSSDPDDVPDNSGDDDCVPTTFSETLTVADFEFIEGTAATKTVKIRTDGDWTAKSTDYKLAGVYEHYGFSVSPLYGGAGTTNISIHYDGRQLATPVTDQVVYIGSISAIPTCPATGLYDVASVIIRIRRTAQPSIPTTSTPTPSIPSVNNCDQCTFFMPRTTTITFTNGSASSVNIPVISNCLLIVSVNVPSKYGITGSQTIDPCKLNTQTPQIKYNGTKIITEPLPVNVGSVSITTTKGYSHTAQIYIDKGR